MPTILHVKTPEDFQLATAVCSYGYFILAPHRWVPADPSSAGARGAGRPTLLTEVHDAAGRRVAVRITQRSAVDSAPDSADIGQPLRIRCDRSLDRADWAVVRRAVRRMLRIDEDLEGWYALHRAAGARRWGRLFRSATLFEDIARTITGCNIGWTQTIRINRLLCEQVGGGAFPTPLQLARCTERLLRERCRTGYRADRLLRLARDVAEGRLDLAWFEQSSRGTDELYTALRRIHGVGDYAATNVLQHLGRYDRLPVDSELVRHVRERHGIAGTLGHVTQAAADHYARFAPYQFLAYWYELWHDYERAGAIDRW